MYGNNFYSPFMSSNVPYNPILSAPRPVPNFNQLRGINNLTHSFGKNNIFSGIKGMNWSNMLNNASKTLGLVKEAIPVVREVRPMMNNMKSMLKIASVFKDETDAPKVTNNKNISTIKEEITTTNNNYTSNNNEPNFFI